MGQLGLTGTWEIPKTAMELGKILVKAGNILNEFAKIPILIDVSHNFTQIDFYQV